MRKTSAVLTIVGVAAAACGGGDVAEQGGVRYEEPAATAAYEEPAEVAAALNANGVDCNLEGEPAADVTGAYGQTCWLPDQSDQLAIDIYKDAEQQAEGLALLKQNGWEVVEGELWSVSTQRPATATKVAEAMRAAAD